MPIHDRIDAWLRRARALRSPGSFLWGTLTVVAGTGTAQLVVLIATPLLTRLYPPADHGVLAVATSILFVLMSVTCLRYDFAVPLPESDIDAANLVGLALLANLLLSAAVAVVLVAGGSVLLDSLGLAPLGPLVALLAVAQFGGGTTSALINWVLRSKDFGWVAGNRLTQSAVLVAVQLGLGVARVGAAGLFLGVVISSVLSTTILGGAILRRDAGGFRQISRSGMAAVARRYRRFPIVSTWSAMLAALGVRAPLLLIVALQGTAVGGEYALAERMLYLPLTLIAGSVSHVFVAEAAQRARVEGAGLASLFRETTIALTRIAIGPAIAIAILAPILTVPLFGPAWTATGLYVTVLVPMFLLSFIATATGNVLNVVERQGLNLLREVLRLGLLAGSVLVAGLLGLEPLGTIVLVSLAGCATYALYLVISWHAVRTHQPVRGPAATEEPGSLGGASDS